MGSPDDKRRSDDGPAPDVDGFVEKWSETGGSESANAQLFVVGLCRLLGLPEPDP